MADNVPNEPHNGKRTMTKVRRQFLNRRADECDSNDSLSSSSSLNNDIVYSLNPSVGLVEINGKVLVDPQYFNLHYTMTTTIIQDHNTMKAVMVHLSHKEDAEQSSLETAAKRLESYGDLELATWAHRIRKHQVNYPQTMAKYFGLMYSGNPDAVLSLKKSKSTAIQACRDIEGKYPYCKVIHFFGKESNKLMSCTYNEWFLEEVGHTVDSFMAWSKENGLLHFIDSKCTLFLDFAKQILEGFSITAGPVYEGPEYTTMISDKEGKQKESVVKSMTILEPNPEGYFLYEYFLIKEKNENPEVPKAEQGKKYIKKDEDAKLEPSEASSLSVAVVNDKSLEVSIKTQTNEIERSSN